MLKHRVMGEWVDFWVTSMPESDVVMSYERQRLASQPRRASMRLDAASMRLSAASAQPQRSLDATDRLVTLNT